MQLARAKTRHPAINAEIWRGFRRVGGRGENVQKAEPEKCHVEPCGLVATVR